jgi:PAB1-binding protein PBP1
MASAPRQSRPQGKRPVEPARRAWTGARASPTFSPVSSPRPSNPPTSTQPAFPPLSQTNGARPDTPQDRTLQSLAGLTGTTITLRTKTGQHYEGAIASTSAEGDTTGVTLRDARDISIPGQPLKDTLFIASTNISGWNSGPANAKAPADNFRTDTEISQRAGPRPNRELQAWLPSTDAPSPDVNGSTGKGDEETFGAGTSGIPWDQFAANEELFGITPQFDENVYTTKLDRSAADFKERERKAQRIANEIIGATTSNPHVAEERNQVIDDSGADEENKYSTVVRGTNAYIPPGARKGTNPTSPPAKADVPKVSVNGPDGATIQPPHQPSPASSKAPSPAPPAAAGNKPPADAVPAFRDFVNHERQRLAQKKQALVKSEIDKKIAEFRKFSQSFKLNKPIPDDLVSILAKDESKQQSIRDKSSKDASSTEARSIGVSLNNAVSRAPAAKLAPAKAPAAGMKPAPTSNGAPATNPTKPAAPATSTQSSESSITGKKLIPMVIQAIPAFKGPKKNDQASPPANVPTSNGPQKPSAPGVSAAAAAANRLNVDASSFRPNPKANAFSPGNGSPSNGNASANVSPKPKESTAANAFFGMRVIKKGTPVQVKDDFNPFKTNPKLPKASATSSTWTDYNGKRYMSMYPSQPSHPGPQQPSPHMAQHAPPPAMPPPSYEEDQAAASQRYAYMYPPYGYPGQPMMPGMAPPGPPGAYVPAQFMQAIPYPHGMPPPGAMYSPAAMGQMPPQGYMPPPPGTYPPPPNGAGRPSMPPTPIPAHAHPYYPHQSPQSMMPFDPYSGKMFTMPTVQHAIPYPMMMPPPGAVPQQHPYEGGNGPSQPVQMGGHA